MEISRLYINIYVTINARVVWLFSFVHFHEPGAPPPKRAPWYLQCAAWLETSSRRASLDFVVQKYWTNRPGGVRKTKHLVIIWFFKCQTKKWRIDNTQPLNNLCKSCIYCRFKFPLETSKLPTTCFVTFRSKVRFHGTTEHCHGPPDHRWNASIELGSQQPWILMEIYHSQLLGNDMMKYCCGFVLICHMCGCWYPCQDEEKNFILMQALELWIIRQSCRESGLWACFMLFRKVATFLIAGNDISPISNNQRMVLQETMQTKCTTHTLSVISKTHVARVPLCSTNPQNCCTALRFKYPQTSPKQHTSNQANSNGNNDLGVLGGLAPSKISLSSP